MTTLPLNRACLLLGSNIRPEENLPRTVRALREHGRIIAASQVWETVPVGDGRQPNILNAAVLLETSLTAEELKFRVLRGIEARLDRVRDPDDPHRPRTIDIDIMLWNTEVFRLGNRRIPDPDVLKYAFAAIPLAEVAPYSRHPEAGRSLQQIAGDFEAERQEMTVRPDVCLEG